MYPAFQGARKALGEDASRAKIAYYITGLGVLSDNGKRWSGQTIADKVYIDQVQRESCAATLKRIDQHFRDDPDSIEEWHRLCAHEVREAEEIGTTIRKILGYR